MEKSAFLDWVAEYFPALVVEVVDRANNIEDGAPYLHKKYLGKAYSVDGKWESIFEDNINIEADFVAMDSSLPLKTLNTISKANGDIPKIGTELKLNEAQLTKLNTLLALGNMTELIRGVLRLVPRVINGVYEKHESVFLQLLSTGNAIADTNNVGTGVAINLNVPVENKNFATIKWGGAGYTPITDIQNVLDEAENKGVTISRIFMDPATLMQIAKSEEGKTLFAAFIGNLGTPTSPTKRRMAEAIAGEFGIELEIVTKTITYEADGKRGSYKPFKAGQITFTATDRLGDVIHTRLAEQDSPVGGVNYELADEIILVSQFRMNRPSLAEFTTSQSRSVPILYGVEQMFFLDTTKISA